MLCGTLAACHGIALSTWLHQDRWATDFNKNALNRVQFYEIIQGSAIKVRISNHLFSFQKFKNQ